ncbi:hypothetical protein YPC_2457 [Yersinia pestis biovar Medievalis str. Harbin 35]|nr:hypothetical protein YPC_2457 [Yersinia pestis biovar Medievalis str. Harbin 35]EEO76395.1 hypothetical protein YP516_2597 [Yersinia pestis Nepal516]EEO81026.1 hypothetical protein YPF_2337 [Yersinia pestis biovar Orientalis str. India 195]EEO83579.1 hypothetical protein YPH_4214 [Yersinia pestis biovar Orientalis str. PEXU2]EEO89208.1 hypothetical protein YPS_4076 [Yersinia pestis Pestoides A]
MAKKYPVSAIPRALMSGVPGGNQMRKHHYDD